MRVTSLLIAGTLGLAPCAPSVAQTVPPPSGTIYTTPHRETADGNLQACGVEFLAVGRDIATQRGAPVLLSGSVYIRKGKGNSIFYALKLGVRDGIDPKVVPFAPANAFVSGIDSPAAPVFSKADSDMPGFRLFVGVLDDGFEPFMKSIIDQHKFVVGFNRKPGQMDVSTVIDMDTDTDGRRHQFNPADLSPTMRAFVTCAVDFLK